MYIENVTICHLKVRFLFCFLTINYRVKTLFNFSMTIKRTRKKVERPSRFLERSLVFTGYKSGENSFNCIYILTNRMHSSTQQTKYRQISFFIRKTFSGNKVRAIKRKDFWNLTPPPPPRENVCLNNRVPTFRTDPADSFSLRIRSRSRFDLCAFDRPFDFLPFVSSGHPRPRWRHHDTVVDCQTDTVPRELFG